VYVKPGITEEAFERFVREEWNALPPLRGVHFRVLKGVRGQRMGKYLWLFEWETVERWQETIPRPGEPSAEMRQYPAAIQALRDTFDTFATVPGGGSAFTDYAEIGE
jgi:hypothetical protein